MTLGLRWGSGPDRDSWMRRHGDCASSDTEFASLGEAIFVRTTHSGHGPQCLQSLGAVAYLGGRADPDEYE
ncbi:hypothetical protein [Nocardia brevicatena]|uniref:hypothetical protein n=1 Tax=Nocardia brevicatena TaxID=37327 RepID=UPI000594CA0E|nr:hypothetical protein [Nocardia brevicatena]